MSNAAATAARIADIFVTLEVAGAVDYPSLGRALGVDAELLSKTARKGAMKAALAEVGLKHRRSSLYLGQLALA